MKRYDCDVCQSAGSVNRWGFCEICGEEIEDPESIVSWREENGSSITVDPTRLPVGGVPAVSEEPAVLGQNAA